MSAVTASLELIGHPSSTCTQHVLAVFNYYKEAPGKFHSIDWAKAEHKSPAHLKLQPFGQVPVLKHGDFVLFESRAIGRYVDWLLGGKLTGGDDVKQRALVEAWISVDHDNYNPRVSKIVSQVLKWHGPTDQKVVDDLFTQLQPVLDAYDLHLGQHKYLAGETLTLADVGHLPYTEKFVGLGGRYKAAFDSRPNLSRWWKDISSQPFWQSALTFAG